MLFSVTECSGDKYGEGRKLVGMSHFTHVNVWTSSWRGHSCFLLESPLHIRGNKMACISLSCLTNSTDALSLKD